MVMKKLSKNLVRSDKETESVRLNKYMSDAGFCSRREADRLIADGKVLIDGEPAVMGQKVLPGQTVSVDGQELHPTDELILLAFYKPAGIECTTDLKNPDNIIDYIGYPQRIYPVGRLDKNSKGLILLTNTGDIVNQILKASNYHEKEYLVTVDRELDDSFLKQMRSGVRIYLEDGKKEVVTRKCKAHKVGKNRFSIVLTQGFNRQIRRMCKELGYRVTDLKRIRIMNIRLDGLKEGDFRHLTEAEIKELVEQ